MRTVAKSKELNTQWFGKIPSDWRVKRISALFDFPNEKVSDEDFEPLSVTYGGIKKQVEGAAKTDNGSNRRLVRAGDIAINGRSDRKGAVGLSEYDGSISIVYHVLRPRGAELEPKYFHYLFRSKLFSEEFYRWGRGIVDDLWTTRVSEMKIIEVPVPPLDKQRQIADFLDNKIEIIEKLISSKKFLINLLIEKRNAFITKLVTRGVGDANKLVPSKKGILGSVPKEWTMKRLRFFAQVNPVRIKNDLSPEAPVSFVPMEAVSDTGELDLSNERPFSEISGGGYTYFQDGDVIRAKITPCFQNGKGAVATGLKNGVAFGTTELHVLRPFEGVDAKFLYFVTLSDKFRRYGEVNMKGVAGQQRVPEIFIKDFWVALPPVDEQKEIVRNLEAKCAEIDNAMKMIETHIVKLQEFRASLICAAVLGKIA